MKMVSQLLPEPYLELINDLVRDGYYPNHSEAVRVAVRILLKEHGKFRVKEKERE